MATGYEDMQKLMKDNLDTAVKSAGAVSKGFQALAAEATDYSKKSIEQNSAFVEKMMGVRKVEDAVALQQDFAKSAYEGFMMFEAIAKKAGKLDVAALDAASEGASYAGPRGQVTMKARHVEQDIYVADVDAKGFRVVKTFPRVSSGQTCKV